MLQGLGRRIRGLKHVKNGLGRIKPSRSHIKNGLFALLCTMSLFTTSVTNAQDVEYEWAKSMGGATNDYSRSIAVDTSGNTYITGYYSGTMDFDPSVGVYNLTSSGDFDIFVTKISSTGAFVWAKSMGGTSGDKGYDIAVDASGNVYTTGYFQGTVDFDPSGSTFNLISAGVYDIFVQKLDTNGNFVWAKRMGGTGYDVGYAIALSSSGNVHLTGYFQGTADFDPNGGVVNIVSNGGADIFVSELNSSGNFVSIEGMGGTENSDIGIGIAVDSMGNVYITGNFAGTADFDSSGSTYNLVATGSSDSFVCKLGVSANLLWAKAFNGTDVSEGHGIDVDSAGNIYTTGIFQGTVDFDPGAGTHSATSVGTGIDIFINKLDSAGVHMWTKEIGGTGSDFANGITLDTYGGVYVTGNFESTVDFDPSGNTYNLFGGSAGDIFVCKFDEFGAIDWAEKMGGGSVDVSQAIAVDTFGNVFTTGRFAYTADFDPGTGTANLTSSTDGYYDIFVSKLTPSHTTTFDYGWATSTGSTGSDTGNAVTTDALGDVYTTGEFLGTVDFDPGTGTTELTSAGGADIFVQKQDASGNLLWVNRIGDTGYDRGYGIGVDGSANVYTTGYFNGTVDFDPSGSVVNLTSAGAEDIFVQKVDTNGNFLWAKNMGGTSTDIANALSVDASGNVYTTGYFHVTADFDPSGSVANLTSAGQHDIFVSKLDTNGNFVWAKRMGNTSVDIAYGITTDDSGNVYSTGHFIGTADFDPGAGISNLISAGGYDTYIQKLDANGNFIWAQSFAGISTVTGQGIVTDVSSNVYITGQFTGTVDFDPSGGTVNVSAFGGIDIFVSKLDSSGALIWAKAMGSSSHDTGGVGIAVDSSSNVYTTGAFQSTSDFDPGGSTANISTAGNYDVFVSKLDSSGDFVWAKSMGGVSDDRSSGIAVDSARNVYVTGYFNGLSDFDSGAGTANLISSGGDESFVLQIRQAPDVASIERVNSSPTNVTSVQFTVTFSEAVTSVDSSDFVLDEIGVSGSSITSVTGSGDTYTVSVSTGSGDGTLGLNVYDNDSIIDVADNVPLGDTGASNGDYAAGEVYTLDFILPVVTVNSLTTSDTTPELTGSIDDALASISVTVDGQTVMATNNGTTWTVADGVLSSIASGTYDVDVWAVDLVGNSGFDGTTNELTIQGLMAIIYVNFVSGTTGGSGASNDPVNTVDIALTKVLSSGTIRITGGSTSTTHNITQPVTLERNGGSGTVTIGGSN